MDEEVVVASSGSVEDGSGRVLATWTDGLPGKFRVVLPKGQSAILIRTPTASVEQDLSEAI